MLSKFADSLSYYTYIVKEVKATSCNLLKKRKKKKKMKLMEAK